MRRRVTAEKDRPKQPRRAKSDKLHSFFLRGPSSFVAPFDANHSKSKCSAWPVASYPVWANNNSARFSHNTFHLAENTKESSVQDNPI